MNLSMIITNYTVFSEAQLVYGSFFSSLRVSNQPLQYLYECSDGEEEEEEEEEESEGEEGEEEVLEKSKEITVPAPIQNSGYDQYMDLCIPNNDCRSFIVK